MYAETWRVPEERIPLEVGLKVTQIVQDDSPVRGMYIMGENPIISDPDVAHAEAWFRELEFLAVHEYEHVQRWTDAIARRPKPVLPLVRTSPPRPAARCPLRPPTTGGARTVRT